jgi:RNAse (barnase) inhibitor barstar
MSVFRNDPREWEHLDWRLLQNGAVALYHRPAVLAEDTAWLQGQGYELYAFDCARWNSAPAMHQELKRVLGFPAYYGNNLASLIDSLAELDIPDRGGCVVQLRRFDAFARRERALAQTLLDVLETTSRGFLLTGRRFLALAQSDDARISFERVGARPVNWNPREWLESNRGLRAAGG